MKQQLYVFYILSHHCRTVNISQSKFKELEKCCLVNEQQQQLKYLETKMFGWEVGLLPVLF